MRSVNQEQSQASVEAFADSTLHESSVLTHRSYHELSDRPVVESDVLAQLHSNLQVLKDLQGRLAFVMREVRYQLKVD